MRPLFHTMIIQLGLELGTPRNSKGSSLDPAIRRATLRSGGGIKKLGSLPIHRVTRHYGGSSFCLEANWVGRRSECVSVRTSTQLSSSSSSRNRASQ